MGSMQKVHGRLTAGVVNKDGRYVSIVHLSVYNIREQARVAASVTM